MASVAGIIVTYYSDDLIVECVEAALGSGVSRLIVWDNSPEGGSLRALEEITDPRLVLLSDGSNAGFGGAINKAYTHCLGFDHVLLVNPDCFITPKVLDYLVEALNDESTGIVAPRMTYETGQQGIAGGPFPSILKEFLAKLRIDEIVPASLKRKILRLFKSRANSASFYDSLVAGGPIAVDWVSGFCMMIRSELFSRLSGFDEQYFLYFEDVDICRRAADEGFAVKLVRDVSALHLESTSTNRVGKSSHYYRGLSVYLQKYSTPRKLAVARALGLSK
jgi:GT2 family glycosyltransferase